MARLLLVAAAAATCRASFCDTNDGWELAWEDDFSGSSLDTSSWNVHTGANDSLCRDACCIGNNIVVTNGTLVLMSKREQPAGCQYPYTTAAVTTQAKRNWAPSPRFRLCVSAILPGGGKPGEAAGTGVWPAHWMMPDDKSCWPDHGEIDLLEMINGDGFAHGTYHWNPNWPAQNCTDKNDANTSQFSMPADWGSAFHEYAVEHGETYVAFVYDGNVVMNASGTVPPSPAALFPGESGPTPMFGPWPWYLMLNTAIGGPWPKPANASTVMPTNHTIDFVRVVVQG